MGSLHALVLLVGLTVVGGLAGCQYADLPTSAPALLELARAEQASAPADSDEAVILAQALVDAEKAPEDGRIRILTEALKQARKARDFQIAGQAPLPADWPKPSLPGLVRIKTYPTVRSAWVRSPDRKNRQFMTLFRHIEKRKIAMTAPVVMEYAPEAVNDPAKMDDTEAMAFLYRHADQDEAGAYGPVSVQNDGVRHVVSVGAKGAYTKGRFREALESLRVWLAGQDEWRADGPPRVLGYNSPFMLFWRKYSEVQIPVRSADSRQTGPREKAQIPVSDSQAEPGQLP